MAADGVFSLPDDSRLVVAVFDGSRLGESGHFSVCDWNLLLVNDGKVLDQEAGQFGPVLGSPRALLI